MYRRIVLSNAGWINGPFDVLYHVRGARPLEQYRASAHAYEGNISNPDVIGAVVFADSVRLRASTSIGTYRMFEFVLDVPENQPSGESIEEITSTGSTAVVFNENGVVVCRNVPKAPANSSPEQTDGPGEMTTEPIDGPGEMTSVPGEEPGEMAGETTGEPGATI